MERVQPFRVGSPMMKLADLSCPSWACLWKTPKSWPTIGSSQTPWRSMSDIMDLSHVEPERPEPKIQIMFSGRTPARAFTPVFAGSGAAPGVSPRVKPASRFKKAFIPRDTSKATRFLNTGNRDPPEMLPGFSATRIYLHKFHCRV